MESHKDVTAELNSQITVLPPSIIEHEITGYNNNNPSGEGNQQTGKARAIGFTEKFNGFYKKYTQDTTLPPKQNQTKAQAAFLYQEAHTQAQKNNTSGAPMVFCYAANERQRKAFDAFIQKLNPVDGKYRHYNEKNVDGDLADAAKKTRAEMRKEILAIFKNGSGQCPLMREMALLITENGEWDKVSLLFVPTSLRGGDNHPGIGKKGLPNNVGVEHLKQAAMTMAYAAGAGGNVMSIGGAQEGGEPTLGFGTGASTRFKKETENTVYKYKSPEQEGQWLYSDTKPKSNKKHTIIGKIEELSQHAFLTELHTQVQDLAMIYKTNKANVGLDKDALGKEYLKNKGYKCDAALLSAFWNGIENQKQQKQQKQQQTVCEATITKLNAIEINNKTYEPERSKVFPSKGGVLDDYVQLVKKFINLVNSDPKPKGWKDTAKDLQKQAWNKLASALNDSVPPLDNQQKLDLVNNTQTQYVFNHKLGGRFAPITSRMLDKTQQNITNKINNNNTDTSISDVPTVEKGTQKVMKDQLTEMQPPTHPILPPEIAAYKDFPKPPNFK